MKNNFGLSPEQLELARKLEAQDRAQMDRISSILAETKKILDAAESRIRYQTAFLKAA